MSGSTAAGPFLTPSTAALLAQIGAQPAPPDDSPAGQRAALDGAMATLGWRTPADIQEPEVLPLPSGASVHLCRPRETGDQPQPLVVYMHGGSFVAGGPASHNPLARALAAASGAAIALVDYRRAPEHQAPAALDDCLAAVRLLVARAAELRLDAGRLALLGDSAGGALAAGAALALREELRCGVLVLVNPMISPTANGGSLDTFATGYFATRADFAAGWRAYRGAAATGPYHDLLAVSDLCGLPPTIVLSNEADPVRDQGEAFAERLSAAGVPTLSLRARGLVHAAWLFPQALPEARLLLALIAGALRNGTAAG